MAISTVRRRRLLLRVLVFSSVLVCQLLPGVRAQSETQQIAQFVVAGGGGSSSAGALQVDGTIGQNLTSRSSGGSFTVNSGFWIAALITSTPSPTPNPTPTATATASATPAATATVSPTTTPSATATPTVAATASPTIIPGPTGTPSATPTATPAQALNISTRARVDTGSNVVIAGFIVTGNADKNLVIRGLGPSLVSFGISDVLTDPTLELHGSDGSLIVANNNWQDNSSQAAQLNAVGLAPRDPNESGIFATLQPGAYTAIMAGKNKGSGIGVIEVYDTNGAVDAQLANISTRGFLLSGHNVMIAGFILRGDANTEVVVRGIGPSLARFGLSPTLADPTLELHDGNGTLLIANDNWADDPGSAAQLTAKGLAPTDPKESGIFTSLPAGQFTAILADKNDGAGIGVVEVYNLK